MKISVLGAGRIGGTIGGSWEAAGHEVVYGLRDPSKKDGARSIADSLKGAEVVLLAVPAAAVQQIVNEYANELDHKLIIDATNNVGGVSFQQWASLTRAVPHAQLYRAFNTYGFDVFAKPILGGETPDLFYCGAEGAGKEKVEKLIVDVGLRPVWVGGPDVVDTVDGVLRLWFVLSQRRGRRIAFKLITD